MTHGAHPVPLCVDLDGTLVRTDTLHESVLRLLKNRPWLVLAFPLWLARGKAHFKTQVACRTTLDTGHLPYRPEVVDFLRQARSRGQPLVLTTAAHRSVARSVADDLGIFDDVLASTEERNLKGPEKARQLAAHFGMKGFDYIGDSKADLPVWAASRKAYVVGEGALVSDVERVAAVDQVFGPPTQPGWRNWMGALRIHQWAKNVLVFVPLLTAHKASEVNLLIAALTAFFAFSLCASAVYIVNDLLDLDADRGHARKRERPFASGQLSIASGMAAVPLLLAISFLLASRVPVLFALVLVGYFLTTLLYSLRLKRMTVVDVLTLAGLYTLRLFGGAFAVGIELSFWLLAFSMFLFLSLALVKRCAELGALPQGEAGHVAGRAYRRDDLPALFSMGVASGYGSVLVLALYINGGTSHALYSRPEALWLLCPLLLFWVTRVWLVTHRGQMLEDPVVFAFRDSISRLLVVPMALVIWAAL